MSFDKVQFKIGNHLQTGTIENIYNEPTQLGDHIIHASSNNPMFLIRHDNTGTEFTRSAHQVREIPGHKFHKGDHVEFNLGNHEQFGTIEEEITKPTEVEGHIAHASRNDPMLVIKHDHTGTEFNRRVDQVHEWNPSG